MFVGKNGAKLWRLIYTFDKKQKKLALGGYPGITLEAARRKAEEAKDNIANGIDPMAIRSEKKKAQQLLNSNIKRVAEINFSARFLVFESYCKKNKPIK